MPKRALVSSSKKYHVLERDDGSVSVYYTIPGIPAHYVVWDSLNKDDPKELKMEIHKLKIKMREYENALRAIKTGTLNIPPEHSYGWWTEKKLTTTEDMKQVATDVLKENK